MRSYPYSVFIAAALASAFAGSYCDGQHAVTTSDGSTICGFSDDVRAPDVRQFLGVPFAEPPVGTLRWEPPIPPRSIAPLIDATKTPAACPQNPNYDSTHGIYDPKLISRGPFSEDCLTLNVWTPTQRQANELLPVIIFIFGGTFQVGSTNVPYYDAASWVQRSQKHIVVTINYRVNIFGFPGAPGLSEQNLGLLDHRLAVEYIRDNIASFGEDPERMILWGESDGGASVDFWSFSYPKNPIVYGLIMDSGTAFLPGQTQSQVNTTAFRYVSRIAGCTNTRNNAEEELKCMRKVPAAKLEDILAQNSTKAAPSLSGQTPPFRPVADDKLIFRNYTARAMAGNQTRIPAVVGHNSNEAEALLPVKSMVTGPNQTLVEIFDLVAYICPAVKTTRLRQEAGLTTYRFEYAGNFTNVSPTPWLGAQHAGELPLIFGSSSENSTALERNVSIAMQDAWVAFAYNPLRGPMPGGWPYNTDVGNQVRLWGLNGTVSQLRRGSIDEDKCIPTLLEALNG